MSSPELQYESHDKYSFAVSSEIIALSRAQQDTKTKTMHMLTVEARAISSLSTRHSFMPPKCLATAIIANLLLLLASCSSPSTQQEQVAVFTPRACAYADETILEAPPPWVCGASIPGAAIVALGKSEPDLVGGPMYQESQATRRARAQLLVNIRAEARSKVLQYLGNSEANVSAEIEQVVQSVVAIVVLDSLFGSVTYRSLLGPDGWFYVLVGMDRVKVDKLIARSIAASMEHNQDLWSEFASQMRDADLLEPTNEPDS